jgi:hypothetical protein
MAGLDKEARQTCGELVRKTRGQISHPITPKAGVLGTPVARRAQIPCCAKSACSG